MKRILAILLTLLWCSTKSIAGPWFTGPLLAPAGHTIPAGHVNFEPYLFITDNNGIYNRHWRLSHAPLSHSVTGNPIFTYGLTDHFDIQYSIPYAYNTANQRHYQHISDVSAILGYQALEQGKSKWLPDLRITLQEIFPSGKFRNLDPTFNGIDATGSGSYQTVVALNFQHLFQLTELNYLRTRLSVAYQMPIDVHIRGYSSYGGGFLAKGSIDPGNMFTLDGAAELNITQNWVLVMEGYYVNRDRTHFNGFPGFKTDGTLATVGHDQVEEISLAPAIEYNFNENVGLIAGYWWSIAGKNAVNFNSVVIALNLFW